MDAWMGCFLPCLLGWLVGWLSLEIESTGAPRQDEKDGQRSAG